MICTFISWNFTRTVNFALSGTEVGNFIQSEAIIRTGLSLIAFLIYIFTLFIPLYFNFSSLLYTHLSIGRRMLIIFSDKIQIWISAVLLKSYSLWLYLYPPLYVGSMHSAWQPTTSSVFLYSSLFTHFPLSLLLTHFPLSLLLSPFLPQTE